MRLIDADALKVDWYDDYEMDDGDEYSYPYVSQHQIDKAQTIDAVPVVRCKDCKYSDWYTAMNGKHLCYCTEHGSSGHNESDYCSYGEREDNE